MIPLLQVFFTSMPTVALAIYCLLMLFFCIAQKDGIIRAFMWMLAALIIWTASAVFMTIDLYPGVLFWDRIMVTGMLAVPFFLYYFVSVFTNSINKLRLSIWGIFTLIVIIINQMGYVVTEAQTITNLVTINGRVFKTVMFHYSLGLGAIPVYLFMFVIIGGILGKAKKSVSKGGPAYERVAPVILGIQIMFAGCLCNIVSALGKYPVDVLACLINAILIFVAIYRYRLIELRFMVTKGLVYSLFVALLTVAYIFFVRFVENHIGPEFSSMIPYFTIFTALIVAIAFQPLFKMAGQLVDIMFYRSDYSLRQALRHFSDSISDKLDLNHIAKKLIEAVHRALHAKQILVLMKNEDEQCYDVFQTYSEDSQLKIPISSESPIINWLEQNQTCLSINELNTILFNSTMESEKSNLLDLGIQLIIPIKNGKNIIGLLMLTGKQNNTAYTLDDLDLLNYLGASTAVAFENARLYTISQLEAITDNLTKLYNHRYFHKALVEQTKKIGSADLSLLMIDLDLFKLYNDINGHLEGDRALEIVAQIMLEVVGPKGIVCRYGGEEFTILLPYHDSQMAFEVAEKIRLEVQNRFFNLDDVTQRFLTVSIGICTYPHAAPNVEELLNRADLAMYTAKNQGKNQTVIYTPRVPAANVGEIRNSIPNYTATIYALAAAIDTKDHYTFGHSQRVAEYVTILAGELGLDNAHIEILREAALLHDIGKIGIPEEILTKAGKLTPEEYDIVKRHAEMSITIIKHIPSLNHVIPAVIAHHERWDGKGYPRGLKEEGIPLAARILAIADSFDAMTSNRPYRAGLSVSSTLAEISNNAGKQFDPVIAKIFIKLVSEGKIRANYRVEMKSII